MDGLDVVLERIGGLDRRIESVGSGLHRRLDRHVESTEGNLKEIKRNQETVLSKQDAKIEAQAERISDAERAISMIKGGIVVLALIATPLAARAVERIF